MENNNKRELKFRVWHEKDKCFIYCKPFDPNTVGGGGYTKDKYCYYHFWPDANISGELCEIKSCHLQNRPIQQFTGLTDKNGKEIYEGDIIKYIYSINDERVTSVKWGQYNDGEYVSRIDTYICEEAFGWALSDLIYGAGYNYGYAGEVRKNSVEVIGNIYETPEFLKNV